MWLGSGRRGLNELFAWGVSRGIFLQSPNWSRILFFNHPLHALILFLDKHAVIAYADSFWNWNARILLCSQEGLLVRAVLHGLVK